MMGVNMYNVCTANVETASNLVRGTDRTFIMAKFV